ncbi:TraM recognition domain-containing protein [Streptomyces sp. H10-C2]|uniref:type IV secretory system conjugative DNA transfer family protein n=1 Tax=Streptomyces TaxID=1883 RepID=UPI0018DF1C74|nr:MULTISPECIES: TraM recognition domain-containing protein [Streptomyces]MDJ0344238.1 TraM recognition domain-containing protein [Streptomyces sp. PH10-H1]MDJ0373576.1 TraM recognition domain-containing protein [Streptomyces sp. H10-C2]
MSATNKRRGPNDGVSAFLLPIGVGVFALLVGVGWTSARLGAGLSDKPLPPGNPFVLPFALAKGTYVWPGGWATGLAAGEGLVLVVLAVLVTRMVLARRRARPRIDAAAQHMAKGRELDKLSAAQNRAAAVRWGITSPDPGIFVGRTVIGRRPLFASFEDMQIDIWGPRTGKTTRRAIPAIVRAGAKPLFVTSNKRDVVDATRGPRSEHGSIRVFDLQGLIGEAVSWWWNPLTFVTGVAPARRMAEHFASDARGANARTDAYFEPAGQDLLAYLLLAAALDGRPITQVYRWLSNPREAEPERILRAAGAEYVLPADAVKAVLIAPEKQRGGIYGTALQMASCLVNPAVTRWVTDNGHDLPQLDPREFVRSTDTLYLVSREGKDSAGALVTALTVAICEAAEQYASQSPHGRVPGGILGVLDEAANVCRWAELPNLYSHYGSRGINLMTILQSWEQGVEVWGEGGMAKLWGAANLRVYGGGAASAQFLSNLGSLVGNFEPETYSHSYQPPQPGSGFLTRSRSTSTSSRSEEILSAADLAAVPPGRAVVMASGARPTLIETIPWWTEPYAPAVQASLDKYDPGAVTTP